MLNGVGIYIKVQEFKENKYIIRNGHIFMFVDVSVRLEYDSNQTMVIFFRRNANKIRYFVSMK